MVKRLLTPNHVILGTVVLLRKFMTKDLSCSGITLVRFHPNTSTTSCCPSDSLSCGGCASYASGKCDACLGGYELKYGVCLACIGTAGWTNELGETCDAINITGCNDRPVNGQSSNQACCLCKGGHKSPTPFAYPDARFVVGAAVHLAPVPRTAKRYSLNVDCGFAAYNLTLNGETGEISYEASKQKPTKAFSVQCEVTAHQGVGLVSTTKVSVSVDFMNYGSNALIFSATMKSFAISTSTASSEWKDYSMTCAPAAPWLSLSASGQLTASTVSSTGAVTEAEKNEDDFVGMDGAVCVVTAMQKVGWVESLKMFEREMFKSFIGFRMRILWPGIRRPGRQLPLGIILPQMYYTWKKTQDETGDFQKKSRIDASNLNPH